MSALTPARRVTVLAALLCTALACGESGPTAVQPVAQVLVHSITPATVRALAIEVSGAGIAPAIIVNIPVGMDNVASGSLAVPAGGGRRFVITAVDTSGTATHRGDTTITVLPGVNPTLSVRLQPIVATVGVTVTFGDGVFVGAVPAMRPQ